MLSGSKGVIIDHPLDLSNYKSIHDRAYFGIPEEALVIGSLGNAHDENDDFAEIANQYSDRKDLYFVLKTSRTDIPPGNYLHITDYITGDEKMVIMGGKDITNDQLSIIPEILDLNKVENGWSLLKKAESEELFGNIKNQREWSYPRSFLASDGNIVGISYNKIWVMDKNDNFRIRKTAEIPLEEGGVAAIIEHIDPNSKDSKPEKLKTLTVGSPVGDKNSVVMIEKDKLLVTGGLQNGEEYSGSNKVFLIDFSDSFNPKISKLSSVKYPRVDGDSVLLPNGKIFISGGTAFDNLKYSIFISL